MSLQAAPPPPATAMYEQSYAAHSGSGSIGPVIGVLAMILVLGVIAGVVGRLCSGSRIFGYGQFDFEGLIERKCASCIDGRIELPPPSPPVRPSAANGGGSQPPTAAAQESKQAERRPPENPPETAES